MVTDERDSEIAALKRRLEELERAKSAETIAAPEAARPLGVPVKKDRTVLVGLAAFVALLVLMLAYCSIQSNGNAASETFGEGETKIQQEIAASVADRPMAPVSLTRWSYRDDTDPMTDRKTHFACVTSTNQVRLNRPYDDVKAELCIRQSPRYGLDAYVQLLGNGQIICRSYNNCAVKVRFGDGAQQSFSAADSADGSSNVIFISNASRFVAGAKAADVTRVQMTFYEAGDQVVEFNTKGLEWPRSAG